MKVRVEFTLDELDLIGALVCRDRDQIALPVAGYADGTQKPRILIDAEAAAVPVHTAILQAICDAFEREHRKDQEEKL